MDFLKSAVASAISKGPLGAYVVGDRVDLDNSIWTLHNATKREDRSKCSVLSFNTHDNRSRLPIAKNAVRKARILHHPGLLKILDTIETETNIYIVTEFITPLAWYTRRNSLAEETLKWGLWSIAKTLKFINEDASSVHGCVRTSAVFINNSGEWKLGGFELLSSVKEEDAVIYTYSSLVPESSRYMPPEVAKSGWDVIKRHPLAATDAYGYGTLISEVFSGCSNGPDLAMSKIPPSMQQNFKRLVNVNPKLRLSVAHFLDQGRRDGGFYQAPLINLTEGMERLGLKSEGERDDFLRELNVVADQFPEDYLKRKILPELLKSVEFGGGGPKVFAVVLQTATKLSDDEYESQITPVLIRLFASPDRAIRICLLDNLPLMIDHLSQKNINDKIFPNLITGFTDLAPIVREQTVKAVLIIVTKLSDRVINGELLRYLAKTANDEQPGIRTNTTICLGKLAKYLGPNTRTKVLVAAFTRSLRDPFVHARNAALLALAATSDMFSEDECASKILPAVCPSLLDKEKIVRDQASKAVDIYLIRIRKHGETLPESAIPLPTISDSATNTTSSAPRMSAPSNDPSWAGWAISSFTNKLAATDGDIQPAPTGITSTSASRTSSLPPQPRAQSIMSPSMASLSKNTHHPALSRHTTETTKLAQSFAPLQAAEDTDFWNDGQNTVEWGNGDAASDVDDAWGTMEDGSDDAFFDAPDPESIASPEKTSSAQQQRRSIARNTATTSSTRFDDQGEPDFAGWLKAQQSQKLSSSKVLPKGLGVKSAAGSVGQSATAPRAVTPVVRQATVAVKPTVPKTNKIQPKEKNVEDDEGWGDAWQ